MKSKHIKEILDRKTYAGLDEQDKEIVSVHIADCLSCQQAFEASRLSSILLQVNSTVAAPEPSAFFQAKVMNAWRERQMPRRPIAAFRRWWQASAMPVFLMLVTMAVLISLTFLAPQSNADDSVEISGYNLYSTDAVILHQKPPRDLTNEQVFQVIYSTRSESKR